MNTLYDIYRRHSAVTTDSRRCPEGSIFFALHGDNFDGNNFAAKALDAGAAYAVVDKPEVATDHRYIVVPDTLKALQDLAAEHRSHLNIPIVGITGTNGKTTTKELVTAVLATHYRTTATIGNLNNHIGVPLTLLSIQPDCQIAVVEMGANHPGEIATLAAIVRPTVGLITNVGKAHLQGFGSIEGVLRTKTELYDQLRKDNGTIFVNAADPMLIDTIGSYRPVVSYSANPDIAADINARTIPSDSPYLRILWGDTEIHTSFIGTYNINNMLAAIAVGRHFNVPDNLITAALTQYTPGNSRSQLLKTDRNTIIVDAYNANPTSMAAAIDSFTAIQAPQKIAILGDMLELGTQSHHEHQAIIDRLTKAGIQAILVGHNFATCHSPYTSVKDTAELTDHLTRHPLTAHTILLKGSNGIGLQSVVKYL